MSIHVPLGGICTCPHTCLHTWLYTWLYTYICLCTCRYTWLYAGILERNVQLDEDGDALEPYSVINYLQQADGMMLGVEMGLYDLRQVDLEGLQSPLNLRVEEIRWPGNMSGVPLDTAGLLAVVTSPATLPSCNPPVRLEPYTSCSNATIIDKFFCRRAHVTPICIFFPNAIYCGYKGSRGCMRAMWEWDARCGEGA